MFRKIVETERTGKKPTSVDDMSFGVEIVKCAEKLLQRASQQTTSQDWRDVGGLKVQEAGKQRFVNNTLMSTDRSADLKSVDHLKDKGPARMARPKSGKMLKYFDFAVGLRTVNINLECDITFFSVFKLSECWLDKTRSRHT
jgi:hypothetical protein